MRVAINLRQFRPGRVGGIENYVRAVVGGVAEAIGAGNLTIFALDVAVDVIHELAPGASLRVVPLRASGLSIDAELDRDAHDVLFCPVMGLDPPSPGLPAAAMIADLAPVLVTDMFDVATREARWKLFTATARGAERILTLSEFSRQTLLDVLGLASEKVVVTPCDVGQDYRDWRFGHDEEALPPGCMPGEYLFFPANYWRHKNHSRLLAAIALLESHQSRLQLLLTGDPTTGAERVGAEIATLGVSDHVQMLGYRPTHEVAALMRNARAVVFPTLFEGFGIPLLEAFHAETPVIASAVGGTTEVIGDAAVIVDPEDPQSIAEGIERVVSDEALRSELVRRGRVQRQRYSWAKTVTQVVATLTEIAKGPRQPSRIDVREPLRVSVVTPISHDCARRVLSTVESVLAQEYPYYDYVVVAAEDIGDPGALLGDHHTEVRWIALADARAAALINHGFEQASGDLFGYVMPGARYFPDTLWRAAAHFHASGSRADVIQGATVGLDSTGAEFGIFPTRDLDPEGMPTECRICQSATFVSHEAFREVGGLDEQLESGFAQDLWIRLWRAGKLTTSVADRFAAVYIGAEEAVNEAMKHTRCAVACGPGSEGEPAEVLSEQGR